MNIMDQIISEIRSGAEAADESQIKNVAGMLAEARNKNRAVFLAGAGRSGCIASLFANRLMHLGFNVYRTGEITAVPIRKDDILFVISGSGKTSSLVSMTEKARSVQARICTVTLNPEGTIGKYTESMIVLSGSTRLAADGNFSSVQPVGSVFEQLAFITCETLTVMLRDALGMTNEDLIANHANLE